MMDRVRAWQPLDARKPCENIYGHRKRLEWIEQRLTIGQRIVELGCGTGYMVTGPLLAAGHDVTGIDLDEASIRYGKTVFTDQGLNADRLITADIGKLAWQADVIIASEVLEHVPDAELNPLLDTLWQQLKPGGIFLVTVPNGFGWFELESWAWYRLKLGTFLSRLRIDKLCLALKIWLTGKPKDAFVSSHPASLDCSPHVQRFTLASIQSRLAHHGFEVRSTTGSTFLSGPFSNLLFTGIDFIMRFNNRLGTRFPALASSFYIECSKPKTADKVFPTNQSRTSA